MPADLRISNAEASPISEAPPCVPLVPGQLGIDAVEVVGRIHRSFLQLLEPGISELLQLPVEMSAGKTMLAPLSQTMGDIGLGDRTIALDFSPPRGCAFLTFPAALLFRVLDVMLATPGNASDDTGRSVTGIEMHILGEFFQLFVTALKDAWEPFYPVAFNRVPTEEEGTLRVAESRDDLALTLRCNVVLAGAAVDVNLILPAFLARLAQLRSVEPPGHAGIDPVRGNILECLGGATLRLDAVMDGASIRIRDLLSLAPGQILTVGSSQNASFDCLVNGSPQFKGELVASRNRCALQVEALTGTSAT